VTESAPEPPQRPEQPQDHPQGYPQDQPRPQHYPQDPRPQPQRQRWGARAGGGAVAAGGAAAAKTGLLFKLLLAFKGLAVLAKFKFALSMIVSIGAYALFWGWKFAVGFVLLIAVHEIGHVVVLRAQGVEASAPMFIPFLGAFVSVRSPQRSVADEAASALAGPAVGAAGAWAVLQVSHATGSPLLQALAYTGFFLNLFNLLPMLPMDGGRVAGALHPALWIAGMAAAVLFLLWHPTPVLVFVLVIGGLEVFRRWRAHRAGEVGDYYAVPPRIRALIAAGYVTVALFCLWGMHTAYLPHSSL
jgi:Zn-dependent protease